MRVALVTLGLTCGCYLSHGPPVPSEDPEPEPEPEAACGSDDPTTWRAEHWNAGGYYDRAVAAVSGLPWIALRDHDAGIVLVEVTIGAAGIVLGERHELPDSAVYPIAFDTDGERFALLTATGINWNGAVDLWLFEPDAARLVRQPFSVLGGESTFTVRTAVALVGRELVVAGGRFDTEQAVIERRDEDLALLEQVSFTGLGSFTAIRLGPEAIELYTGPSGLYRIDADGIAPEPAGEPHDVIGGLGEYRVEIDDGLRIRGRDRTWEGEWPHTQISPPAVLRYDDARVAFSLQLELSGAVGYSTADGLEWIEAESDPLGAGSGLGAALMPVVEARRLGFFYLGLEIPHPEQPLRYFGRVCD